MFMKKYSFNERWAKSQEIIRQYPHLVPVICEPDKNSTIDITTMLKTKFLVSKDTTIGKFLMHLRSQLNLQPEHAIFLFIKGILPPTSALIGDIYEKYKSDDNFLYMVFSGENAFGLL